MLDPEERYVRERSDGDREEPAERFTLPVRSEVDISLRFALPIWLVRYVRAVVVDVPFLMVRSDDGAVVPLRSRLI